MKALRIELLIATLALLASAAASIATVVQTNVVAKQLSASVWPYLTIEPTFSPDEVSLAVIDDGLGPALIRDVVLTIDGKPQVRWRDALRAIARKSPTLRKDGTPMRLREHDFGSGSVIRPGESATIIDVRGPLVKDLKIASATSIDMTICYCSILQQCWIVEQVSQDQPKPVADCGNKHGFLMY